MKSGMDDVIAAETLLSHVDGEAGRLVIRGHDLEELAGRVSFEDTTGLLWSGVVATPDGRLSEAIGQGRAAAFERFRPLAACGGGLSPIEAMRLLLSRIGDADDLATPAGLLGATGTAAAMAIRLSHGEPPLAPDPTASHAEDILRMVRGSTPSSAAANALDAYLVAIIDHGLNASTFAARVVASTGAGAVSSVIAALCALKGPLHGGAPGPVLDMLDAAAAHGDVRAWLVAELDAGRRLMGFGHRIYRTRDPRADVLKAALAQMGGSSGRAALAGRLEAAALALLAERKAGRRLDVNVEFYTALLLDAVGLPRQGFTPVFAAGRAAGWLAHAVEQETSGRLIRPQSLYLGSMPDRAA